MRRTSALTFRDLNSFQEHELGKLLRLEYE